MFSVKRFLVEYFFCGTPCFGGAFFSSPSGTFFFWKAVFCFSAGRVVFLFWGGRVVWGLLFQVEEGGGACASGGGALIWEVEAAQGEALQLWHK